MGWVLEFLPADLGLVSKPKFWLELPGQTISSPTLAWWVWWSKGEQVEKRGLYRQRGTNTGVWGSASISSGPKAQ